MDEVFQSGDVGLAHPGVHLKRECEGDVDVDSLTDQVTYGGDALRRGGHLYHRVGTSEVGEEPLGGLDCAVGVVGQVRVDLQGCEAVCAAGVFVHGPEQVRGGLDVLDGERFERVLRREAGFRVGDQGVVVVVARRNSLLEDRGVRGQAGYAGVDEPLELAAPDQCAVHVVVPDALAKSAERLQ